MNPADIIIEEVNDKASKTASVVSSPCFHFFK